MPKSSIVIRTALRAHPVEVRRVAPWQRIHLCTGLLERDGAILLVANRYPNQPRDLWNLPGGRQDGRETCVETVVREFREEVALDVTVGALAYVAESFDPIAHAQFTMFCFHVVANDAREPQVPPGDAHVRGCEWIPRDALAQRLAVGVVREPLVSYLADPARQYFGYRDAGVTIAFADGPAPSGATPRDGSDTTPHRRAGPE